jgi:hypothetical protein
MTRLLVALLGFVLWWPSFGLAAAAARDESPGCSDAEPGPMGQPVRPTYEPSQLSEGGDSEVEDALFGAASIAPPDEMTAAMAARLEPAAHEPWPRPTRYDVFARERGPPTV